MDWKSDSEKEQSIVPPFGGDDRIFVLRVDGLDTIRYVNDAWLQFARENAAVHLNAGTILNKPLWNFIAVDRVLSLTQNLMRKVRHTGAALMFPFRCDSPARRRLMEMEISSRPLYGLEFRSRVLREELREPVSLLDPGAARSEDLVSICSWCNRMHVADSRWTEVEEGIRMLNLFGRDNVPRLTHGICPACLKQLESFAGL